MEDDLKILKVEYLSNLLLYLLQFKIAVNEYTFNVRRPKNNQSGISQQPLIKLDT